ncbi:hypothetical protein MKX03_012464 [Papaver bracteatum]|nr:hypothetical protein MKX03_012464 [Papaver bracteatum]
MLIDMYTIPGLMSRSGFIWLKSGLNFCVHTKEKLNVGGFKLYERVLECACCFAILLPWEWLARHFCGECLAGMVSPVMIEQVSSKLLQPIYNDDQAISTTMHVPLTIFDRLAYDQHVPSLYAYKPPNPSNTVLERGLQKALSEYREWAGRFGEDDSGQTIILFSDEGLRFIEASADCTLDQAMPFTVPTFQKLTPSFEGVKELALVQVTRFTCGSFVLSFKSLPQACRGIDIHPRPLHDRNIFVPRNPSIIKFDHTSFEMTKRKLSNDSMMPCYTKDDLVHQVLHCTPEFIAKLKSKASSPFADDNGGDGSIDVHLTLFQQQLALFDEICYNIDICFSCVFLVVVLHLRNMFRDIYYEK